MMPGIDPATALLVLDAAAAALEPDLCHGERERTESDLSHVLDAVDPMLPASPSELDWNEREPVCTAGCTTMRWQRPFRSAADPVRILRLARRSSIHVRSRWQRLDLHSDGWPAGFASFVARVPAPSVHASEPRAPAVGEAANVIVRTAEN